MTICISMGYTFAMNKPLPIVLLPPPFAPGDTDAVDDTGLMPWYRGYSDAARSVVTFCPYVAGTLAASLWHHGASTHRTDKRVSVRRIR